MEYMSIKGRRTPVNYTEGDLQAAKAEVQRLAADTEFRGRSPGRHRAALQGAMTRVEMIQAAISGVKPRSGRPRMPPSFLNLRARGHKR